MAQGSPKAENIKKVLCLHTEPVKREFWNNIPIDDASPDLQVERDPNEEVFDVTGCS